VAASLAGALGAEEVLERRPRREAERPLLLRRREGERQLVPHLRIRVADEGARQLRRPFGGERAEGVVVRDHGRRRSRDVQGRRPPYVGTAWRCRRGPPGAEATPDHVRGLLRDVRVVSGDAQRLSVAPGPPMPYRTIDS